MGIIFGGEESGAGMQKLRTGKVPLTLSRVLFHMSEDWPVINTQGVISLGVKDGKDLKASILNDWNFPEPLAQQAVMLLEDYVAQLNKETATIRRDTVVTSTPELAMRFREVTITFQERLGREVLRNNLEASGAIVHVLNHADDSKQGKTEVWMRDLYVLEQDGTALLLPYANTRATWSPNKVARNNAAVKDVGRTLEELGITTRILQDNWSGGGDILQHPQSNTVFVGVNVGADGEAYPPQVAAAETLAKELGMALVTVPKIDNERYYHLDTLMSVLPDGSIVLLPDATTKGAAEAIANIAKKHGGLLELPRYQDEDEKDAYERRALATNIITVNGNSFTENALPEMKHFMAERGLTLIEGPYYFTDSGPHCQINLIKRGKGDGRSDVAQWVSEGLTQLAFNDVPAIPDEFNASVAPKSSGKTPPQLG